MKAVKATKFGGPEVLDYTAVPTPQPGPGEVLVRVKAAGVNFADVYQRMGKYPASLPFILGNEAAGVVERLGPGVERVKPGDRVAFCTVQGTYAEYVAVPVDKLVPLPATVNDQIGAAAMVQGMTAHYLSHSTYAIRSGDVVLVHAAAGGVGLLLTQMSHRLDARVIATVSPLEKAALARAAGSDHVIL